MLTVLPRCYLRLRLWLLFVSGDGLERGCARIALLVDGLWGFNGGYAIPYMHAPVFRAAYSPTWEQEVSLEG